MAAVDHVKAARRRLLWGAATWLLAASAFAGVGAQPEIPAEHRCRPDSSGPVLDARLFAPSSASDYVLPYEPGSAHRVWRTSSHFTPGNGGVGLYAIDFGMPMGTPIVAARAGTVVATRHHFSDGNDRDLEENYVMVRHDDGSIARYIHLRRDGVLVGPGQEVRQGERIALSGNSGQTGGPHLHFDVQRCGPNLPPAYNQLPCGMTLPVNFRNTEPHRCGLEAGRRYTALPGASPPR